jgi:hypothetical protein
MTKLNRASGPRSKGATIALRQLILAALLGQFLVGEALAARGGHFTLAPGEVRSIAIGSTYRDIRVCNDLKSVDDLGVTWGDNDPVRLWPGICKSGRGDRITLRNDSKSTVFCVVLVIGKHQS